MMSFAKELHLSIAQSEEMKKQNIAEHIMPDIAEKIGSRKIGIFQFDYSFFLTFFIDVDWFLFLAVELRKAIIIWAYCRNRLFFNCGIQRELKWHGASYFYRSVYL